MQASLPALELPQPEALDRFFWLSPDPFCIFGFDGALHCLNPAWEELLGATTGAPGSRSLQDLVAPEDREATAAVLGRLVKATEALTFETRCLRRDGTPVRLAWKAVPFPDERRVYATVRPIAEPKQGEVASRENGARSPSEQQAAERRRAWSFSISRMLSRCPSLEQAGDELLKTLGGTLKWHLGLLWLVDRDANVLRCHEIWHSVNTPAPEFQSLSRQTSLAPGVELPGEVWSSGEPGWIADLREGSGPRARVAFSEGLHAALAFPLRSGRTVLGVIEFYHQDFLPPDEALLEMVAAAGGEIGHAMERTRAEGAQRRSEQELADSFENAPTGMQWVGPDGIILRANRAELELLGYPAEEYVGRHIAEFHVEPQVIGDILRRLWAGETLHNAEARLRCGDGSIKQVVISANVLWEEGRFIHARCFTRDVTEWKAAESALRVSEECTRLQVRRLTAMRAIDLAISSSLDLQLSLNVVLDQITAQLGIDAAAVLLFQAPVSLLQCTAARGFWTSGPMRMRVRLGEGYAGRAALERRRIYLHDLRVAGEPDTRLAMLSAEQFVGYCAAPLIAKGQVKGVLELYHRTPLDSDPEWMEFFETVAGQAAIAVDNAALFEELQRSNTELAIAYDTTLEGWSRALELRDLETEGHTRRVTDMTVRLARAMGIGSADLVQIYRGALLHDIGKMGIPDAILLKPSALTDEETEIMRRHPVYAHEMLWPIPFLREAIDIPYCHHEQWDGTGYPRGLKGSEIPLAARIFAIADVWDALRSERPYRPGWPEARVREYLRSQAGVHFDPHVVEMFLMLEE